MASFKLLSTVIAPEGVAGGRTLVVGEIVRLPEAYGAGLVRKRLAVKVAVRKAAEKPKLDAKIESADGASGTTPETSADASQAKPDPAAAAPGKTEGAAD